MPDASESARGSQRAKQKSWASGIVQAVLLPESTAVCSALMIWKSLMVVTESDSPVVVVLRCAQASQGTLP